MTDETDTMSEVARAAARVLGDHGGCRVVFDRNGTGALLNPHMSCGGPIPGEGPVPATLTNVHQAAMLAEAGLLDDAARPEGIERWEVASALTPFMDMQTRYRATAAVWKLITRKPEPEQAQIATQEPAGEPVTPPEGVDEGHHEH